MAVKVTLRMLREWGATCPLEWFEKEYPSGVTGTIAELVRIPKNKGELWWFVQQAAIRLDTQDGDDAYNWAVANFTSDWLATLCIHTTRRSVNEAKDKVLASKDEEQKQRLVDSGLAVQ